MKPKTGKRRAANQISFDVKPPSAARRKEIRSAVAFVKKVTTRFDDLGLSTSARTEAVGHDLAEIHEIFRLVSARLQRIISQRSLSADRTRGMLVEIQRELFLFHLPYHLRQLKRPLERLIDDLAEGKVEGRAKRTGRRPARSR